jgi:hypothetical protein
VVHDKTPLQRSYGIEMTTTAKETRRIEDIKIGSRFRKDLGNIDSLTKTIQDVGLLQPIGITDDNKLVYGARRLEACKRLGWSEIPVNIIPLKDIIKGEFIENSARKDFTFSERQAILTEIESMRIGHRVSKDKVGNLQTFQQDYKGKPSVNIVAEYTGISPRQLAEEKAINEAVKQNPTELMSVITRLDKGEISVNEATKLIKSWSQEQEEQQQLQQEIKRLQQFKQQPQEQKQEQEKSKKRESEAKVYSEIQDEDQRVEKEIERLRKISETVELFTGMDECQRTRLYKELPKGKAYAIALVEQCRKHMIWLSKTMSESDIKTALGYLDDLLPTGNALDAILYDELQRRKKEPKE